MLFLDFREFKSTNNDLKPDSNHQEEENPIQQKDEENESEFELEDGEGNGDSDSVGSDDDDIENDNFEITQSNANEKTAVPFEPAHGMMEYANYFMQPSNSNGQLLFASPANSIQANQFVPMPNVIQLPAQSNAKNATNKKDVKMQRFAPYPMMLQSQAQPMLQAQTQSMMLSGQNVQFLVRQPTAKAQSNAKVQSNVKPLSNALAKKASKHIKANNSRRKNQTQ